MSKKILILNGSPRRNGNTSQLVASFQKGAQSAGHQVTEVFLDSMKLHGCKGCFGGGKDSNHPCVQRDDMEKIYPFYRDADIVVFASPLYYWNISGQLKMVIDRLFAIAECHEDYENPKKDSVLLMAAEGNGFDETVYWYDHFLDHMGWTGLGKVLCGGVMGIGDIKGRKELEEAETLGASM